MSVQIAERITRPPASATSAGMSDARLGRIEDHLKRIYVDTGRFPGTHVLVWRRGRIVHSATQGFADVERNLALADDTIFRIYSMTKPITSVAFMMLVEEGRVALDEPVAKHIPEWRDLGVYVGGAPTLGADPNAPPRFLTKPVTRPMQIIDLLRHTSGLTYGFMNRTGVDAAYRSMKSGELAGTLDGMIQGLATVPLEFSPGTAWNYSVATDVLGYLIGKLSGMPLERFLQERIFDPLGMSDTGFFVPPEKAHRLAACYSADGKGGKTLSDDPETSPFRKPPNFVSGGGGLVSTTSDYLKFCRMLLGRGALGDARLLSPKTLALMTSNHLPGGKYLPELSQSLFSEATLDGVGFGLGFAVTVDPARTLLPGSAGEFYWGGAASTAFWIDPAEDMAVIFMTQLVPSMAYPVRRDLRTLVYAAITDSNL